MIQFIPKESRMKKIFLSLFVLLSSICFSSEMRVNVGGAELYYEVHGEGDPIVILHGGPGLGLNYFNPQMLELAKNHQLIFYDQRGCGKSTGNLCAEEMNIDRFVEDLDALRQHLGFEKVSLLGHSWGAVLAAKYASQHSDHVKTLILANPGLFSRPEFDAFIDNIRESDENFSFERPAIEIAIENQKNMLKHFVYDPAKASEINFNPTVEEFGKTLEILDYFTETLFLTDFDFRDELKCINCPTLIIHGKNDLIPMSNIEIIHNCIRSSYLCLIDECGHYPYVEKPNDFFGVIERFLSKNNYVKVDGAELYYQVFGEGDPIIVLHGGPGLNQNYFFPQMLELAKNHQLIFYDQRGCGKSTGNHTPEEISIEQYVLDLEALRINLGLNKVTLCGHSFGGILAARYASSYPDNLNALILMNPGPLCSEGMRSYFKEMRMRLGGHSPLMVNTEKLPALAHQYPEEFEMIFRTILSAYLFNPKHAEDINIDFDSESMRKKMEVDRIVWDFLANNEYDYHEDLNKITCPSLIIHGTHDPIPPHTAEKIGKHISDITYFLLEECGHLPFVEKPDEFFPLVEEFLEKVNN